MPLSWNEIKSRAIKFSKEWESETKEHAEAKSFWDDFFNVFGIGRRRIASFEEPVKKLGNRQGFIDLFWKGNLIVEHKSKGKDLDKAYQQAIDYFPGIKDDELPKYILVSDFVRFRIYDLDENSQHEFLLSELHQNIKLFGFIAGYQKIVIHDEDPINIKAAEKMGKLHDLLKENGYDGHELEVYLVRLLFMLFADDTGIFEKDIFRDFIENHTAEDGSDLAIKLAQLFQVLNKPEDKRQKNLDELYRQFPYVNGKLFEESLSIAAFDSDMRKILLESCALDWGLISPAIFGSLFQSIMDKQARRNLGVHYTSEKNILKLIKPLFLDGLWEEFEKTKTNSKKLAEFHKRLGELKFLDPACGSGNFLIIAYRELRKLELAILDVLYKNQIVTSIEHIIWIDVDQFYGIEIDEWAARIAEVAMWLIDHQMNMQISEKYGSYFVRIPLKKSVNILNANSLQTEWQSLLNPKNTFDIVAKHANIYLSKEPDVPYGNVNVKTESYKIHHGEPPISQNQITFDYILGNPPFIGSKLQTEAQRAEVAKVFGNVKDAGIMDYVSAWFIKAAKYIQDTQTKVAFVSTNSISQGEQTSVLWAEMLNRYKITIHFAHKTFKWSNEAKGQAAVYVIITGFANFDTKNKVIFDYEDIKGEPTVITANNINPYLVDAPNLLITKQNKPISNVPFIKFGNQPNDGGGFLFSDDEKEAFLKTEPNASKFIRRFMGSREFINNIKRWCLWLPQITPNEIRSLPHLSERIGLVKKHRLASSRPATVELAQTPTKFGFVSHVEENYIIIPSVSSERRKYIPIGFMPPEVIASNLCLIVPQAKIFHFGILTSEMHMTWVKYTCGRLKSDYRYSNTIVYNNYPFPKDINDKQKERVEKAAQAVLDSREKYPDSSLADLYDPLAMPPDLVKAHKALDKAVDLCYRPQAFTNERTRIEFLFDLYSQYTAPLRAAMEEKQNKRKKRLKSRT